MHFGRFPRKTLLAATLLLAFSSANASFVEQIGTPSLPLATMGTYAADAKLKSGLKAVIPAGWQLFQHQSVEMPDALSWEPADTWVAVLNKFASKNDIAVLVDWDKKAVYFRSTSLALQEQEKRQMIAQAASTPLPSFARPTPNPTPAKPADKPAIAAAEPKIAAPAVPAKASAAPVLAVSAAPANAAAPAPTASVAPVTPAAPAVSALAANAGLAADVKPAATPAVPASAPLSAPAGAGELLAAEAPAPAAIARPAASMATKPVMKASMTRPALRQAALPAAAPAAPTATAATAVSVASAAVAQATATAAAAAIPVPPAVSVPATTVAPAIAAAVPAPVAQPAAAPVLPGATAFNREAVSKVVATAGAKHGYTVSWEAPQVNFPGPVTLLGADMGEDMRLVLRALGGRRAAVGMTVYRDSKVVVVREAPYGKADVSFTDVPFSGTLREPVPLKEARTLFAVQPTIAVLPPAASVPQAVLPPVRPAAAVAMPVASSRAPVAAPAVAMPAVAGAAAPAARVATLPAAPSPAAEPLLVTPEPARLATAVESVKKLEPAKPAVAAELRTVTLRVAAGGSLRDAIEAQLEPGWSLKWDVAGAFEANTELKASGESLVAVLNQVLPRLKLSADIYKPSKLVVVREADPALDK